MTIDPTTSSVGQPKWLTHSDFPGYAVCVHGDRIICIVRDNRGFIEVDWS